MRELTAAEMQQVNGGLSWGDGAAIVFSLSPYSPITAAFGVPIGTAMLVLDYYST